MKAYFVTNFGDINLEQKDNDVLITTGTLTLHEEKMLNDILCEHKVSVKKLENTTITIKDKKLKDVHKFMAKKLKINKPTLTAVKYKDGTLELVSEISEKHKEAKAAVTTEKPTRGCPMPSVTKMKEVKASEVLKIFLTNEQTKDFEKHRSFVSIGNYTRHPYMVTSRWSSMVERYGQVYDIVNKMTVCANCREIPPSEEMLAMKLSIELNEREFIGM